MLWHCKCTRKINISKLKKQTQTEKPRRGERNILVQDRKHNERERRVKRKERGAKMS